MKAAFIGRGPDADLFTEPNVSDECRKLEGLFYDEITSLAAFKYDTFMVGCEKGADILFAEQVLKVKAESRSELKLVCVIPYEEQANDWSEHWRDRYFSMTEKSDDVITLETRYSDGCYFACDRYMIDEADTIIMVCDNNESRHSWQSLQYAQRMNCRVIVIDASTLMRTNY